MCDFFGSPVGQQLDLPKNVCVEKVSFPWELKNAITPKHICHMVMNNVIVDFHHRIWISKIFSEEEHIQKYYSLILLPNILLQVKSLNPSRDTFVGNMWDFLMPGDIGKHQSSTTKVVVPRWTASGGLMKVGLIKT